MESDTAKMAAAVSALVRSGFTRSCCMYACHTSASVDDGGFLCGTTAIVHAAGAEQR